MIQQFTDVFSVSGIQDESGQALIELSFIIILCVMLGVGFYEAGALVHNLSVMNKGLDSAANYASKGASYDEIRAILVHESENFITGAFLMQDIPDDPGLVLEVWNPETNTKLGAFDEGDHTYRQQCSTNYPPREQYATPYLFWAQGYEIRIGIEYQVGIKVPFMPPMVVDPVITGSKRITVQNDIDRDGMVDAREAEYVQWAMIQKANAAGMSSDTEWIHPVHRDEMGVLDTERFDLDIDGDGDTVALDPMSYDKDNDGIEDRFDKAEQGDRDNLLTMNPLIGPGVQPNENDDKWWGGDCPEDV